MKIISQKRDNNQVVLEIEADDALYQQAQAKALARAGRQIKVPGFRPGKAPRELVAKAIDPEYLESQAAQDLIAGLYPRLIAETKIEPVDYPSVEIVQRPPAKPFVFKITVDVYPDVKLGRYKGLKMEKKTAAVTEEEVSEVLGNLQSRIAKTAPDGTKEQLPLDNEFAQKVSQFGTLAELKAELRTTMQRERESQAEAEVRNALIAAASQEAKVDLPGGLVEREINIMLDELKTSLAESNLTLDDYLKGIKKEEPALRAELRKSAEVRVKGKVVLRAVARAEKITVSEDEVAAEVKKMAEDSGENQAALAKRLDEGMREYIKDYLLRSRALDFLLSQAKITEKKPLDGARGKEAKK